MSHLRVNNITPHNQLIGTKACRFIIFIYHKHEIIEEKKNENNK